MAALAGLGLGRLARADGLRRPRGARLRLVLHRAGRAAALQLAQANLAVHFSKDPHKGIAIIRRNCFPTFSNQRGDVNTVWWAANVAIEEKRLGHPMSKMETIRLRRKLGCDGDLLSTTVSPPSGGPHASSGKGGSCVVGPLEP